MSEKTKIENLLCYLKENLLCFLFLGIILFCIIIYMDYSNAFLVHFPINVEFWSSLISAVIGSAIAIFGVYWTLNEENKRRKEDLKNSHKPFLRYYISIGVYPYRMFDQSKRTAIQDYEFEISGGPGEQFLIFPLHVENIRLGHAIIQKISINGVNVTETRSQREKIIKKDDDRGSVFFVKINKISKEDIKNLKVVLFYKDLIDTEYKDTIQTKICEGNPVLFDIFSAKEALDRYFKIWTEVDKKMYREKINETINETINSGNYIVKSLKIEKN